MKVLISLFLAVVASVCLLVAGCSTDNATTSSYSRCGSATCKAPVKKTQSSKMHLYAK